jgi:hypothetical protein
MTNRDSKNPQHWSEDFVEHIRAVHFFLDRGLRRPHWCCAIRKAPGPDNRLDAVEGDKVGCR